MKRLINTLAISAIALAGIGCGEDCGLSGSQCDLIDCSYDALTCHKYATPNDAIKIFYKRTLEEGFEYAAIIVIDLVGVEQVEGLLIEGTEFTDRVSLYRPGTDDQWPGFDDGKLNIKQGGDAVDRSVEGKASFRFTNGYFASACFKCTLEAAED